MVFMTKGTKTGTGLASRQPHNRPDNEPGSAGVGETQRQYRGNRE